MNMLRCDYGAEVFAFGRHNVQPARRRNIHIAGDVDLHAVDSVLTLDRREVEKQFPVLYRAVRLELIAINHLAIIVPVADVEIFLIGRKCDAVRPGELCREQL